MNTQHLTEAVPALFSRSGRWLLLRAPLKRKGLVLGLAAIAVLLGPGASSADSINSPNITLNVDANRSSGPGGGGAAVVVNTITLAETTLSEYSAGAGRAISIQVRPGFQFDSASSVTAQSATIGFNGGGINVASALTPSGAIDEVLAFELTSGTSDAQDIIRLDGIRILIHSAPGAAGPAQTTMSVTSASAGGAFTDQGIVAATITRGAPDRLVFSAQPGSTDPGAVLLPAVKVVDFGGNLITTNPRVITLALQENPGADVLLGITAQSTVDGVATWVETDELRITNPAAGYTLRAAHDGPALLSSDTADSEPFNIGGGTPDHVVFTLEPANTPAGGAILATVTVQDALNNTVAEPPVNVTLDAAVNPGGWPLLVDTSRTKPTVNGVATWNVTDNLRINKAVSDYRLLASGVGAPVQSAAFDITAAGPAALRFVQQPGTVQEDSVLAPPVSVEILDEFQNRTNVAATIDMVLRSTCGGTLSGGTAVSAAGLATFAALRIDTPCTAVTLQATSAGLTGTTSDAFSVEASVVPGPDKPGGACGVGAGMAMVSTMLMWVGAQTRLNRRR